ncbi:hypothetical protein AAA799D07_00528 [Marine Group I thaumarchaeote SCGC AAA799-D07]|nr:hypothetical protein AAA799D07_00528 [Marine Group I thaumarchaeote SCGC AAA799-D07]
MKAIFITGTAGSGKSLLTSKILQYYEKNGTFASVLNLDPGVESLPYTPDIDVREHVDIVSLMKQYDLGPNGSMIMANDLIASKIDQIENEINNVNPDYLIVDTPGQIELFAYRNSGRFFIQNINADEKTNLFLYDGTMIISPENFISISLLAASIKLRLGLPTINVMTKTDLIPDRVDQVLKWSSDPVSLEESVRKDSDGEVYSLTTDILRSLNLGELTEKLIPISNATEEGMVDLESALSRVINLGEEVED